MIFCFICCGGVDFFEIEDVICVFCCGYCVVSLGLVGGEIRVEDGIRGGGKGDVELGGGVGWGVEVGCCVGVFFLKFVFGVGLEVDYGDFFGVVFVEEVR